MGNPKKDTKHFRPDRHGDYSLEYDGNKGRKYQSKENDQPDYIPPKGDGK
ncbi:MAG: acid-soluble spore protein N [Bacillaceae bacterium]|nr:acid-soluble spore protein N [Bacillaceae bacterium]